MGERALLLTSSVYRWSPMHDATPPQASFHPLTTAPPGPPPTTRLAPSPTGALHLGNARTFLVTWALARSLSWRLVLRIEDLDTPRVKPETIAATINTLQWLGIDWDTGPITQSHDLDHHRRAMRTLAAQGLVYPSPETRSAVEEAAAGLALSAPQAGAHDTAFPAALRPADAGAPRPFAPDQPPCNWRFLVPPGPVAVADAFAGPRQFDVAALVGDFVVWTKRGCPAYQLAVVVDDARQGVTQVVRGDDLLDSAARQTLLLRALGLSVPAYTHLPLVLGPDGRRLAKRHGDTRVDAYRARGVKPERLVGLMAWWCGLTPARRAMDPAEFRERLTLGMIPPEPVTFTAEDDEWLVAKN